MRVGIVDIETSPATAYVWTMWGANVSLAQLLEPSRILAFAWKWDDEKEVTGWSEHHDGTSVMLDALYELLNEADVVVHYNGVKFDMRHIRRALLLAGYPPIKPPAQVDLLRVVRKEFAFQSNKLDHVADQLLGQRKVSHEGFGLWAKCLEGDPKAWDKMLRYCIGDVRLTGRLYRRLLPYIHNHPSAVLRDGGDTSRPSCNRCPDGGRLQKRGFAYTAQGKFQQYACRCGAWIRGTKRVDGISAVGVAT